MHLNGNWAIALTALGAARHWVRAEIVIPSLSVMVSVIVAVAAFLGDIRDMQRDQKAVAEIVRELRTEFDGLRSNHNALAGEYRQAIGERNKREDANREQREDMKKRIDRIEERMLVPPPNSQPRRER